MKGLGKINIINTRHMKRIFSVAIIVLTVLGCNNSKDDTPSKYSNTVSLFREDYPVPVRLVRDKIHFDSNLAPAGIKIYEDYFFILNQYFPKISVYSRDGKELLSFLNNGRGPSEVFGGRFFDISSLNHIMSFYDNSQNKLLLFELDPIVKGLSSGDITNKSLLAYKEISLEANKSGITYRVFPLNDKIISISPQVNSNNTIATHDFDGKLISIFGNYPEIPELENRYLPLAFMPDGVIKSDESRMALFYNNTDLFEIYDTNGTLIKKVHGPDRFYSNATPQNVNNALSVSEINGLSREAYYKCVEYNGMIWVLYSGRLRNSGTTELNDIYVYDWDGNPVAIYNLDCETAVSFDIDAKNNTLYLVEYSKADGLRIISYKL